MTKVEYRPVGTVAEAAEWYGTDVAGIWDWVSADEFRVLDNGSRVRLSADRKNDSSPWGIMAEIREAKS